MAKMRYACDGCGKQFWLTDLTPYPDNSEKEYCNKCWEKLFKEE